MDSERIVAAMRDEFTHIAPIAAYVVVKCMFHQFVGLLTAFEQPQAECVRMMHSNADHSLSKFDREPHV